MPTNILMNTTCILTPNNKFKWEHTYAVKAIFDLIHSHLSLTNSNNSIVTIQCINIMKFSIFEKKKNKTMMTDDDGEEETISPRQMKKVIFKSA